MDMEAYTSTLGLLTDGILSWIRGIMASTQKGKLSYFDASLITNDSADYS